MKSTPPSRAAVLDGTRRKHVVDEPTMQSLLDSYAEGAEIPRPADKATRDRLLTAVRDVQRNRLREAMWNAGTSHAKLAAALKTDPNGPKGRADSWLFNSLYNDRLIDREEAHAIARLCSTDPVMLTQHLDRMQWLADAMRGRRLGEEGPPVASTEPEPIAGRVRQRTRDRRNVVAIAPADGSLDGVRARQDLVMLAPSAVQSMSLRIEGEATLAGLAIVTAILKGFELAFGLTTDEIVRLRIEGTQAMLEFDVPIAGVSGSRVRITPAAFGLDSSLGTARISIVSSLAPSVVEIERERRIAGGRHEAIDDTILDEIVLRMCTVEGVDVRELVHAVPEDVRAWSSFELRDDHETRVRLPIRLPAMSGTRTVRSLDVKNVGLPSSIVLDVFGRSGVAISDGTAPTIDVVGRPVGEIAPSVHPAIADLRIVSANQEEHMTLYMLETRPMHPAIANPADHAAGMLLARRLTDWANVD